MARAYTNSKSILKEGRRVSFEGGTGIVYRATIRNTFQVEIITPLDQRGTFREFNRNEIKVLFGETPPKSIVLQLREQLGGFWTWHPKNTWIRDNEDGTFDRVIAHRSCSCISNCSHKKTYTLYKHGSSVPLNINFYFV